MLDFFFTFFQNESLIYDDENRPDRTTTHVPPSIESEEDSGVELSHLNDSDQGTGNDSVNTSEDGFNDNKSDKTDSDNHSAIDVKVVINNSTDDKLQSAKPQLDNEKDADETDSDKKYTSATNDSDTDGKKVLKDIAEEDESESAGTDSSYGDIGYCRGDFDRDVCTPDSSVSDATFKRSRSFGDRPTRRRTVSAKLKVYAKLKNRYTSDDIIGSV